MTRNHRGAQPIAAPTAPTNAHRFIVVISRIHQLRDLMNKQRCKGMRWPTSCIDVAFPPESDIDGLERDPVGSRAVRLLSPRIEDHNLRAMSAPENGRDMVGDRLAPLPRSAMVPAVEVQLHSDLVILARLSQALTGARAVPLAA